VAGGYYAAMTSEDAYLLAIVGRELHRATLIGNAPPAITKLRERMLNPQAGDLVLEISRLGGMKPDRFDPDSIGHLVRIEGDRWVVEPLHAPGALQGWRNATFVALPDRNGWLP
jgi:hypothetical protein